MSAEPKIEPNPKGTFFNERECKLLLTLLEKEWLPRDDYSEFQSIIVKLRIGCEELTK